jgi:hypothetical protein
MFNGGTKIAGKVYVSIRRGGPYAKFVNIIRAFVFTEMIKSFAQIVSVN